MQGGSQRGVEEDRFGQNPDADEGERGGEQQ